MEAKRRDMRGTLRDFLLTAFAFSIVVTTLIAFDSRVREQVMLRMDSARATADVVAARAQAGSLTAAIVEAGREQTRKNLPTVIFVTAGVALTMFMLRT